MTLYRYQKAFPKNRHHWPPLALFLIIFGLGLLANVFLPIFLYQAKRSSFSRSMISPLSEARVVLGASWFPTAPKFVSFSSQITHYNLSIPKLKIENAVVEIDGDDLTQSLIHYSGTALPGQPGNAVIFGHSVLPQFFNPQNYKTIFSTLPELDEGDEILVEFDGVLYHYQVIKMIEVLPQDISILSQQNDAEYLTLITCVPPGTYLRRLAVKAKLVPFYFGER